MLDDFKDKHLLAYNIIINELKNNKISHAYLIDENNNDDAMAFVMAFIKALICNNHMTNNENCKNCYLCKRIDDGNYPEIIKGKDIGSSKQTVEVGDVLLCKINPRINRVWYVSGYTENELIASSEWIVIRNHGIESRYLMYCLRSQYFRQLLLSNVSGVGGSLMRAQPKFVKNYPIPIAPYYVQVQIADFIDKEFADPVCDRQRGGAEAEHIT